MTIGGVARLEKAFLLVTAAEDISKQMHAARLHDWKEAVKKGVITQSEGEKLAAAHEACRKGDRGRRFCAGGAVADLQESRRRASILPGTG